MKQLYVFSYFLSLLLGQACSFIQNPEDREHRPSHAGASLQMWDLVRSFPDGRIHTEKYQQAFEQIQCLAKLRDDRDNSWEALGPKNIGGRTLCLAVNPVDTNIMYAGSASGGIWKTTTAGRGANAWQRLETGFPVLGVSALAIDPQNPNTVYAGTGEVYNLENSMPNVAIRTTRGTYGIGILKSIDGGLHWTHILDWPYQNLCGIQDIKINPKRPATIYAGSSEGLIRSYNGGQNWETVHEMPMAVDIEINPLDTSKIYVTHGSFDNDSYSAVYRSTDGGNHFQQLNAFNNGLPDGYTGKTMLGMSPTQPNILYASVANDFSQIGLYKTEDGGDHWTLISSANICTYQGWYSHDVTINSQNPDYILWGGLDIYKSVDGGQNITQKTHWNYWTFGDVPAGGPEGPYNYVHADIHRLYWQITDPNKVYAVTDGGVFVSYDDGESWQGRNGGYQTQQFYANFGNSAANPNWAIGGMQDNGAAIYKGNPSWTRVLGADGACSAVLQTNDQVLFGSTQYLNMSKSNDGGQNWVGIRPPASDAEDACFNGPFEFSPNHPNTLYAGAQSLFRSDNAGGSWTTVSNGMLADGDLILRITVNPNDPNQVFCSTVPTATPDARVFRYNANAPAPVQMTGLPNRICMDIAYGPAGSNDVYAVFGGFDTQHVWHSGDNGNTWAAIDNGLPDIPTNAILVDPLYPANLYVGNDFGVWHSSDYGASWELYSGGSAPNAMLVLHLSAAPGRRLRAATWGLGLWQTDLVQPAAAANPVQNIALSISPNPATDVVQVQFELPAEADLNIHLFDAAGRQIRQTGFKNMDAGKHTEPVQVQGLPAGAYAILLEGKVNGKKVRLSRSVRVIR